MNVITEIQSRFGLIFFQTSNLTSVASKFQIIFTVTGEKKSLILEEKNLNSRRF